MTSLPINIDSTYADSGTDASVKVHQQHHDTLHAQYNANLAGPITRVVTGTSYEFVDGDVNNIVRFTNISAVLVDIPDTLTVAGALTVNKGGTGNVKVRAKPASTVVLDLEGGTLNTLTTQHRSMTAIIDRQSAVGPLTHYVLSGAESAT